MQNIFQEHLQLFESEIYELSDPENLNEGAFKNIVKGVTIIAAALAASGMKPAFADPLEPAGASTQAETPDTFRSSTTKDSRGRMVVTAMVNGQGPFNFIVDSGANRTVLSYNLATQLGIARLEQASVTGSTGQSQSRRVQLDSISAAGVTRSNVEAVLVDRSLLSGQDGMLSSADFQGKRIEMYFDQQQFVVTPSTPPDTSRWEVVSGRIDRGVVVVTVKVNGKEIEAMIDTGAESSFINEEGARAMDLQARGESITGGTNGGEQGSVYRINRLELGGRGGQVKVTSSNLAFFRGRPGMLLGMDMLKKLGGENHAFGVDFARAELLLGR